MSNELSVGDWRLWRYGFELKEWYVLRINGDMAQVGLRSWMVSDAMWIEKERFIQESKPLGNGRFRWWWSFLPWRNFVTPFGRYGQEQQDGRG